MTAPAPIVVRMRHVRAARLDGQRISCAPGIRAWAQRYGIDIGEFAKHGMPIEQVEAFDDAFAQRAAQIARQEAEAGDA